MFSYLIVGFFGLLIIAFAAWYAYSNRSTLCCEMTGMMLGMVFGTIVSLFIGTLVGVYTGDFVWAMIISTIAGIVIGVPLGLLGGPLGRMEGVMAGPMGGMMGAMLGVMVRPFDVEVFMVFFFALLILVLFEISYVVYKKIAVKPSQTYMVSAVVIAILGLQASHFMDFALSSSPQKSDSPAKLIEDTQTVELRATPYGYSPNKITAKAGVPLKILASADDNAGCGKALVFPDFGINKILSSAPQIIEFTPQKSGTYLYRCSMGMFRGELVVV